MDAIDDVAPALLIRTAAKVAKTLPHKGLNVHTVDELLLSQFRGLFVCCGLQLAPHEVDEKSYLLPLFDRFFAFIRILIITALELIVHRKPHSDISLLCTHPALHKRFRFTPPIGIFNLDLKLVGLANTFRTDCCTSRVSF